MAVPFYFIEIVPALQPIDLNRAVAPFLPYFFSV